MYLTKHQSFILIVFCMCNGTYIEHGFDNVEADVLLHNRSLGNLGVLKADEQRSICLKWL